MIKRPEKPNGNAHRVITFLTREELDFLDKLGKDALFSVGVKISRSKIISAVVNVVRKLNIDACGLRSKKELERRITEAMKNLNNSSHEKPKKKAENHLDKDGKNEYPI